MDDLSQEVVRLIASHLPRWENEDRATKPERGRALLPAYATISRSDELFSRILANHRRKLLRSLDLNVILPTYTDKACAKFETAQDKEDNNQVFTAAIKELLTLLRSWHIESQASGNDDGSNAEPLQLRIGDCYSPKDGRYRGFGQYEEDIANQESGKRQDLFQHRYESSLLKLESREDIPDVPQITFFIRSSSERLIEPRSIALLSTKFPNLEGFRWKLDDNEKLNTEMRQQTRLDFAEALSLVPQRSLKQLHIAFFNMPPSNHDMQPSSALVPSSPTIDHLNLAIHRLSLSRNLTHLDLSDCIVISPSLFWQDSQSKQPMWPNLIWVKIIFNMTTADGEWCFIRDENRQSESDSDPDAESGSESESTSSHDSSTPQHLTYQSPDPNTPDIYNTKGIDLATGKEPSRQYRSRVDHPKINPVFKAAAKAACQMPKLQRMMLKCEVKGPRYFNLVMNYYEVGEKAERGAGASDFDRPRLEWLVGMSGYEPEGVILEVWKGGKGDVLESVGVR